MKIFIKCPTWILSSLLFASQLAKSTDYEDAKNFFFEHISKPEQLYLEPMLKLVKEQIQSQGFESEEKAILKHLSSTAQELSFFVLFDMIDKIRIGDLAIVPWSSWPLKEKQAWDQRWSSIRRIKRNILGDYGRKSLLYQDNETKGKSVFLIHEVESWWIKEHLYIPASLYQDIHMAVHHAYRYAEWLVLDFYLKRES